ncbi:MAG: glycoside hydrolase family 5 protein [Robiginitomaculum sp.]
MNKSLTLLGAMLAFLALTACEKTEQAILDEPTPPKQTQQQPSQNKINHKQIKAPSAAPRKTQPVSKSVFVPPKSVLMPKPTPLTIKRCMNLGNALEAPNEGDWGYTIRSRDLKNIRDAGFDTIRLPVRWDTHAQHRPPYQIDPNFMARVKTVSSGAKAYGLNVIIDVHHYESLMSNTAREEARFLAIWDQIARNFSSAPNSVFFEILNEPTLDISMEELNALYAKTVPIIRASNPTRKLILGGNSWNSIESLSLINFPKDANLVATFHDYGPHAFTHQGAEWSKPEMPLGRRWGGKADAAEFKDTYKLARAFTAKTGIPILVGEFGVIDKVPQSQRNAWVKMRRKAMEENGYAWCAWDYSGAFKAYDTKSETWLPGTLNALFGR